MRKNSLNYYKQNTSKNSDGQDIKYYMQVKALSIQNKYHRSNQDKHLDQQTCFDLNHQYSNWE